MRLFVPSDPGQWPELADITAASKAAGAVAQAMLYTVDGLSVRMRFLHALPPAADPAGRELPSSPALTELTSFWAQALEGVLWREAEQIGRLAAQREWTRGPEGVEVTL